MRGLSGASRYPVDVQASPAASEEIEDQAEAEVIHRAAEVIGDRSDAMRWLGTPVRALNYATPVSLLHDSQGREAVLSVLGRLEHGIL
jgi:putative toxin-antitoxin system antitoxin component (TIGR02293 family)